MRIFRTVRSAACFLIGLAVTGPGWFRDDAAEPPSARSVEERFKALRDEHDAGWNAALQAIDRAGTDEERRRLDAALSASEAAYARRFLALAREEPNGPAAADALFAAIRFGGHGPEAREAVDRLRHDFAADPKMCGLVQQVALMPCPDIEDLLREVLSKNPDRTARGLACQGLANLLDRYARLPRLRAQGAETARTLEQTYGVEDLDQMARRDAATLLREAEDLHERVLAEFADVRLFPEDPGDKRTIGRASESWLASHREMTVGRPSPPIEGKDVDGKPLKLSDYRGKVVLVVFWASWCGPCMAQVPHERALTERLRGKPFALLGVNCDRSGDEARAAMTKNGITWPNWFDGDPSEGPIAARWSVDSLPQVYVLDAEGVIRFKDVRGEALGKAVDVLLAEKPPGR
jgi:thiol-disulfide isomerase/thioredoxin